MSPDVSSCGPPQSVATLLPLALGEGNTSSPNSCELGMCLGGIAASECSERYLGGASRRGQLCPEPVAPGWAFPLCLPSSCSSIPEFCSDQNCTYVSLYFKQRHERKAFPELGAERDVSESAMNAGNKVV